MFVHVEVLKAGAFENIHGDVRYCAKALGTKSSVRMLSEVMPSIVYLIK